MIVISEGQQQSVKFVVDTERCCGCKHCIRQCIENVWQWDDKQHCAYPNYPDECVLCLQCEMECLRNCIDIFPIATLKVDPLYRSAGMQDGKEGVN